jgi:FKBP-type peptidyl-prolyl cis-trans isomerase FkpA
MTIEPKKPRARKAPAAKTPAAKAPTAKASATKAPAAKAPATEAPAAAAPAVKPAAATGGPQGLLMAGVVIIVIALAAIIWMIATGRGAEAPTNNLAEAAAPTMPNRGQLLPSGLRIETIHEGTGPLVTAADTPLVRYELRVLGRDAVVDTNFTDPQPTPMPLSGVVPGFAEALTHMRPGGEARFWVPPNLGYGANLRPGAPFGPNDILEFHVKVEGLAPAGHGATPAGDGNTISEEDMQNIIAAMNASEAAGGR